MIGPNGTYGTADQQRIQEKAERLADWCRETPGARFSGRAISTDDPEVLGWDVIEAHLEEDGLFGFSNMLPDQAAAVRARLAGYGITAHEWQVFTAPSAALGPGLDAICHQPLPDGLRAEVLEGEALVGMQALNAATGIGPLGTRVLAGRIVPGVAVGIFTAEGAVVAAGFGARLNNRFSRHAQTAWVGMISVDPAWRGRALGTRVNAEVVRVTIERLEAEQIVEFVAPTNLASAAMIRTCGLAPNEERSIAAIREGVNFTR